jgi:twitching motility protein PilU
MEKSTNLGMQTFDQALYTLHREGRITEDEALRNADSANNLRLKISLAARGDRAAKARASAVEPAAAPTDDLGGGLSLVEESDDSGDDGSPPFGIV